jgi:thiamine biosynthesis lipoprotein
MQQPNNKIYEFEALGTHWWIESLDKPITPKQKQVVANEVGRFSSQYSRFDNKSLITQLNNKGFINNPPDEMVKMFKFAKRIHQETDGIFNIFVGGILESLGYGTKSSGLINIQNIWGKVEISKKHIKIPDDTRVDFGGFGKGWLIDNLASLIQANGIKNFIINGGGDIYVKSLSAIEFALENPTDPSKSLGTTMISVGALAASSTLKRSWDNNGQTIHHIIDPRKGTSADSSTIASYVKADSALIADVAATCLIISPQLKDKFEQKFKTESIVINLN